MDGMVLFSRKYCRVKCVRRVGNGVGNGGCDQVCVLGGELVGQCAWVAIVVTVSEVET